MTKGIAICNLNVHQGEPSTQAPVVSQLVSGDEIHIHDVVAGKTANDQIQGSSAWYKLPDNQYVWSGGVSVGKPQEALREKIRIDNENFKKDKERSNTSYSFTSFLESIPTKNQFNYHIEINLNKYYGKGEDVIVGVVDTGINSSHNAFGLKMVKPINQKVPISSHGTLIAGLIGANGDKMQGISPNSLIYDCNIFENSGFDPDALVNGINKLITIAENRNAMGVILNVSQSIPDFQFSPLREFLTQVSEKIIIVAAAGEADILNELGAENNLQNPASIENVISVGTISPNFHRNQILDFNSSLNFLMPDFLYYSSDSKSNSAYAHIGKDSAATAVVSAIIANIISSGILGVSPSQKVVLDELTRHTEKINKQSDITDFKIFQP